MGLGVSILSYDGDVTVGVCGDKSVVGDPDELVQRFVVAWARLRADVG